VRFLALIEYSAVIVGIIAVIAGRYFALPKGFHLGIFLIGAGIVLGGLESLVTQRIGFRASDDSYEAYAGAPAMIVGLMALLIGTGFIAAAYVLADGLWHSTVQYLTRRPAPVLIAAGLLLIGIGVLMMLNPRGRRGLAWTLLVRVPRSLLGLVLVAGGLAGIGLGVWEWREPVAFNRFVRNLPQKLGRSIGIERLPRLELSPSFNWQESTSGHSITRSARSRTACGILSPSALAVFRLTTNWNRVGCSIGRSPGYHRSAHQGQGFAPRHVRDRAIPQQTLLPAVWRRAA
jgi:hypothetical protein